MSFLGQPTLESGESLDKLLRAFFQAEMPNPWPSAPEPCVKPVLAPAVRPAASRLAPLVRSRFALAASLALLLAGPFFLVGGQQDRSQGEVPLLSPDNNSSDPRDPWGPKSYRRSESLLQKEAETTSMKFDYFDELPPSK